MLGNRQVQRTLTVGPAGDRFEQEADRIAADVSASSSSTATSTETEGSTPQVGSEGGTVTGALEARIRQGQSGGSAPPEQIRCDMEDKTGADLSGVRIHQGKNAHQINESLGSKAATIGNHIFLARNQSPNNSRLLAHEMTHSVQQGASPQIQRAATPIHTGAAPTAIQRDEDEDYRKQKKKLKRKIRRNKVGRAGAQMLSTLAELPLGVIDQLSVTDLHVKDLAKYLKTGKKWRERTDPQQSGLKRAKRAFGRTGLRGYLHGYKSHKMMYGNALSGTYKLPWNGKYNPFTALRGVGKHHKEMGTKHKGELDALTQAREQMLLDQMHEPEMPLGMDEMELDEDSEV